MRWMRVLAIVLGSVWFFPVSCTLGSFAGTQIVAKRDERHVERGDTVHSLFKVAAVPGEAGQPFRVLGRDQVERYLAGGAGGGIGTGAALPLSFRMPSPGGEMATERSRFAYRVLEDTGLEQLIELFESYIDGDNAIWSRYRATATTVTPVSSRMFYFGYMFTALPFAFVGALLLYWGGRTLRRRLAGRSEAEPKPVKS